MPEENSESFEVVDKRRNAEPAADENLVPNSAGEVITPDADDLEATEKPGSKLPKVSLEERIFFCVNMLQESAWVGRGLIRDPMTEEFDKNLADAKISIDIVSAMVASIESRLDDSVKRDMQGLVRDLRLNYVKQSS